MRKKARLNNSNFLTAVLLSVFLFTSCEWSQADKLLRKGDELRGTEGYEEALKQYSIVAVRHPKSSRARAAYLRMGDVYFYNINDTERAAENYNEVIRLWPLSKEALTAYERKVDLAVKEDRIQSAIDNLSMIIIYFPGDAKRNTFHHKLAKNYILIGNYYQAALEFKELLKRDDLDAGLRAQVLFDLAESYFMAGDLGNAEKYYRMVIDEHPASDLVFNAKWGLSHCLEESGDLSGALEIQNELKKSGDSAVVDSKLIDKKVEELKKRERTSGRVMEDRKEIKEKKK